MNTLRSLAEMVGSALKTRQWKLVTAESCTGGGLSYYITAISGSSNWFEGGYITYSNQAKSCMLGIDLRLIEEHRAVSEFIARSMAEKALQLTQAQISVAITGVAGPDGGTPQNPVGSVWIAWGCKGLPTKVKHYMFEGDRAKIREEAIYHALNELIKIVNLQ